MSHQQCGCGGGPLCDDATASLANAVASHGEDHLYYNRFYARHRRPTELSIAATHWIHDAFADYKPDLAAFALCAPGSDQPATDGPLFVAQQLMMSILRLDSGATLRIVCGLPQHQALLVFSAIFEACARVKRGDFGIALQEDPT